MRQIWPHSGLALTNRNADGQLVATDDLLRRFWQRPELAPVPESCHRERALHAALLDTPARPVTNQELAALSDPDARESYAVMLAFRERLLAAPTLEAAYLDIFRAGRVTVPAVLINELTRIIVHRILAEAPDPIEMRCAELFFRPQKVSLQEGRILLADAETVDLHASGAAFGELGKLLVEARIKPRTVDLTVLDTRNAEIYWDRSEAHDTVIRFNQDDPALSAWCRVMEKWIRHFYRIPVVVHSLAAIDNQQWTWHLGLDAEATALLNDLYRGQALPDERRQRILSLFRMDIADSSIMLPATAGHPVWMACAMNAEGILHVKPQNLLLNLPLHSAS